MLFVAGSGKIFSIIAAAFAMNYAEDRLDRRSRESNVHQDYMHALELLQQQQQSDVKSRSIQQELISNAPNEHSVSYDYADRLLGTTLRDNGWNSQSIFHFARQCCYTYGHQSNRNTSRCDTEKCPESNSVVYNSDRDSSSTDKLMNAVADYAQIVDLAGYPEIGILVLFAYRNGESFDAIDIDSANSVRPNVTEQDSIDWLDHDITRTDNCGCGIIGCGTVGTNTSSSRPPAMPCHHFDNVYDALQQYCTHFEQYHTSKQNTNGTNTRACEAGNSTSTTSPLTPSAHDIIQILTVHHEPVPEVIPIPDLLRFWDTSEDNNNHRLYRPMTPVIQLLLIKLLHTVLPTLALQAVIYGNYDAQKQELSQSHKSHWAYYIFIRSLCLGERIKPERRYLFPYIHRPLWDRIWNLPPLPTNARSKKIKLKRNQLHELITNDSRDSTDGCSDKSGKLRPAPTTFVQNLKRKVNTVLLTNGNINTTIDDVSSSLDAMIYEAPFVYDDESCSHSNKEPLYMIGDSHVLSLAWQTINGSVDNGEINEDCSERISSQHHLLSSRIIVPVIITGLKAWHIRDSTRFFTKTCWDTRLQQLQTLRQGKTPIAIVVSAGEIDCREGMGGPLLQGYTQLCHDYITRTVHEYVAALEKTLRRHDDFIDCIYVMPVPPHLQRIRKGRKEIQALRRQSVKIWNVHLKQCIDVSSLRHKLKYLEYVNHLVLNKDTDGSTGKEDENATYTLHPMFNADATHLNAAHLPIFEKSIYKYRSSC